MSDYTPSDNDVRTRYTYWASEPLDAINGELDSREAEFDRWLNAKLATAWDEGAKRRNGDSFIRENYMQTLAKNPYRPEATP